MRVLFCCCSFVSHFCNMGTQLCEMLNHWRISLFPSTATALGQSPPPSLAWVHVQQVSKYHIFCIASGEWWWAPEFAWFAFALPTNHIQTQPKLGHPATHHHRTPRRIEKRLSTVRGNFNSGGDDDDGLQNVTCELIKRLIKRE